VARIWLDPGNLCELSKGYFATTFLSSSLPTPATQSGLPQLRSEPGKPVSGLSDEARQAVNAAFDAMSAWRIDTAKSNEKNSEQVIEKMAAAARALGWPEQIVDATRAQLQSITKMQIQMMDQLMDAWEEQIKSPNPLTAPSAMLSKLKSLPGVPAGTWPNPDAFAGAAMNPMQFWAQLAEQWQKAWAYAMGIDTGASGGQRRRWIKRSAKRGADARRADQRLMRNDYRPSG
jgi:hypothetical protein